MQPFIYQLVVIMSVLLYQAVVKLRTAAVYVGIGVAVLPFPIVMEL